MKNADYWRGRFSVLEDAAHVRADQCVRDLEDIFREAERSVQADMERWYGRFAAKNGVSLTEARKMLTGGQLEEFKWTVDQYIAAGQQANLSPEWIKKLENASARFHISRLEALQLQIQQQAELLYGNQLDSIDGLLREIVSNGYTRTAYEIQKGLGIGWDITAIDQKKLDTLLSKPWTADRRTFRDRCWTGKANLVSGIQSTLTQGLLRGDSLQKMTSAIQEKFKVTRYQAGRLAHTETTYFNAIASQEAYQNLGVEEVEILESLDAYTCDLCADLDGTVIPMSQYEPGVTVPPFHPNCRGTTCPHVEDKIGKRAARKEDGEAYYVPADMTYREWEKTFVKQEGSQTGSKDDLVMAFTSMGDYLRKDGTFDLEAAKSDYEKFLQSVPEKNRMYLQQAMDGVEYEQRTLKKSPFGYDAKKDIIAYDPKHPMFPFYDFRVVNTHELGHRIDHTMFIQSWTQKTFSNAIVSGRTVITANPEKFLAFAQNDNEGFLSDILSAICEDDYRFPVYHEKNYWEILGSKEKEIFTNLFSLESFGDKPTLSFFCENFPEIWNEYNVFWG